MNILVVEDDRKIKTDIIDDALASLGHQSHWAQDQKEARRLLDGNEYDLVLMDLQIPSRADGRPSSEYGKTLLKQIQQSKGRGAVPIILMTGYHQECVDMSAELHEIGVNACISKPFPTSGRTLMALIEEVLEKHGRSRQAAIAREADGPLKEFTGGVLSFHHHEIVLCGETLVERTQRGYAWGIIEALRERNTKGRYVHINSSKLARIIGPTLGQNTLIKAIKTLRERMAQTMRERLGLDCGMEDVIDNGGQGYHLRDWITVEVFDESGTRIGGGEAAALLDEPVAEASIEKKAKRFSERQQWILNRLAAGEGLTRRQIEEKFDISSRTAKREIGGLVAEGLVYFNRSGHPGEYHLRNQISPGRVTDRTY